MDRIPLVWLRAELRPRTPWIHDEPALALRGALGAAMIRLLCVMDRVDCAPCPHRQDCAIPGWYDPAPGGRPFWLRASVAPDGRIDADRPLRLDWTFSGALPRPSLALEALHRAAAAGLGEGRIRHDVAVTWRTADGWTDRDAPEPVPLSAVVRVPPPGEALVVRTVSRLRLRRDGRALRRPQVSEILQAAVLRVRELERRLGVDLGHGWPAAHGGPAVQLAWETAQRFSSRQGQAVDLSGVRGAWTLDAREAEPYRGLLAAAEVLQLGTATTAGLGVVRVRAVSEVRSSDAG